MIMRLVMSDCEQNSRQKAPSLVKETPTPNPTLCSLWGHSLGLTTRWTRGSGQVPCPMSRPVAWAVSQANSPLCPHPQEVQGSLLINHTGQLREGQSPSTAKGFPSSFCLLSGCGWRICFSLGSEEAMIHETLSILRHLQTSQGLVGGWEGRPAPGLWESGLACTPGARVFISFWFAWGFSVIAILKKKTWN